MDIDEATSVQTLLHELSEQVEAVGQITDSELADFNQIWSVRENAFAGNYDYISVSYDFVGSEIKRILKDVLRISLPEADTSALIYEFMRCSNGQVLKIFEGSLWNKNLPDNILAEGLGVMAATCGHRGIQLFAYQSRIRAEAKVDILTISPETRKAHKELLAKWLSLHLVREFNK